MTFKQIAVKVMVSPRKFVDNKVMITCPMGCDAKVEFDLNSETKVTNCPACRSLIQIIE